MSNFEVDQLEMLSESIKNEIDELQSLLERSDEFLLKKEYKSVTKELTNIISNLTTTNDSIYSVYESLNCDDIENLEHENTIMRELLTEKLSDDDKLYIKLKHGIEF